MKKKVKIKIISGCKYLETAFDDRTAYRQWHSQALKLARAQINYFCVNATTL